jgi:signal transduction histidine kinase
VQSPVESLTDGNAAVIVPVEAYQPTLDALRAALAREIDDRRRAECAAHIQSDAVQLALQLLVREPDITGFFRAFIKALVDQSESHACGVWLLNADATRCDLWMAYIGGRSYMKDSDDWETLTLPRSSMSDHLLEYARGWTGTVEYTGDDARLPGPVQEFNRAAGVECVVTAPLLLPTRNLGWVALSTGHASDCESAWRRALLEAMAQQATLALHHNRLAEQSHVEERRQAVLEERNRMARDIHDTLAQGFGAILMQLQAAQRSAVSLPPTVAKSLETAVDLARTHMIDARRSVSALRPQSHEGEDVAAALRRMTDLARRTTDVPIHLTVGELPPLGGGADREIIGIAQEALTNAVRHARARQIKIHASPVRSVGFRLSVADDGRGIAKEHRDSGFGMTSMQERAERIGASLTIVTAHRSGTEVVLAWEPPSFSIPTQADARR